MMDKHMMTWVVVVVCSMGIGFSFGCDREPAKANAGSVKNSQSTPQQLAGRITIAGSSTVYPITDAASRAFKKVQPRVWVRLDLSGSGRGIKRLLDEEIEIANSSRSIKPKELALAQEKSIGIIEIPVAFDGLAVVANRNNTWVDYLSVEELNMIWKPGSTVETWQDVRAEWPDRPIMLTGATPEDGTFDYFTKAINGESGAIRKKYFAHPDEHVTAPYVAENNDGLGFMGFAWYIQYRDQGLRAIPIKYKDGDAVEVNEQTIASNAYVPLSRPLFIYINAKQADRSEVNAFVKYYLENAARFSKQANYVPLPQSTYNKIIDRFDRRETGSVFAGGIKVGASIDDLMK